jgi:hypothetical protein
MNKHNPYKLPARQIWTDMDLAKFALIAFAAGIVVGWVM